MYREVDAVLLLVRHPRDGRLRVVVGRLLVVVAVVMLQVRVVVAVVRCAPSTVLHSPRVVLLLLNGVDVTLVVVVVVVWLVVEQRLVHLLSLDLLVLNRWRVLVVVEGGVR